MKKITSFDRQNLKDIRKSLETALKLVAEEHGIHLSAGNIRFDKLSFKVSVSADIIDPIGTLVEVKASQMTATKLPGIGEKRRQRESVFTVTAIVHSRPKYPISVRTQNNTPYKLSLEQWNSMIPVAQ